MSQSPETIESLPPRAAPALHEIARGMELRKCRKCACMKDALDQAGHAFETSEDPKIRSLLPRISDYQARVESAHKIRPYSNAIRGKVDVGIIVSAR